MLQNKIYQNFIFEILKTFLVILFGLSLLNEFTQYTPANSKNRSFNSFNIGAFTGFHWDTVLSKVMRASIHSNLTISSWFSGSAAKLPGRAGRSCGGGGGGGGGGSLVLATMENEVV